MVRGLPESLSRHSVATRPSSFTSAELKAVGTSPDSDADREDLAFTKCIGSVWVEPAFRGNGLGTRLIHYLLEMENRKNPQIRQFLLRVLDTNSHAKKMCEHPGFRPTSDSKSLQIRGHASAALASCRRPPVPTGWPGLAVVAAASVFRSL
jgi:hypothetical protein